MISIDNLFQVNQSADNTTSEEIFNSSIFVCKTNSRKSSISSLESLNLENEEEIRLLSKDLMRTLDSKNEENIIILSEDTNYKTNQINEEYTINIDTLFMDPNSIGIELEQTDLYIKNSNQIVQTQTQNTVKKKFVLRKGDWKCPNCRNINFRFRNICNICNKLRNYHF